MPGLRLQLETFPGLERRELNSLTFNLIRPNLVVGRSEDVQWLEH